MPKYYLVIGRCESSNSKTLLSLIDGNKEQSKDKTSEGKRKFDLPKPRLVRPDSNSSILGKAIMALTDERYSKQLSDAEKAFNNYQLMFFHDNQERRFML